MPIQVLMPALSPTMEKGNLAKWLKKVDAEIRKIVNDAAEFATHDPEPDPAELWSDVVR